jgi:hypothetical protein
MPAAPYFLFQYPILNVECLRDQSHLAKQKAGGP